MQEPVVVGQWRCSVFLHRLKSHPCACPAGCFSPREGVHHRNVSVTVLLIAALCGTALRLPGVLSEFYPLKPIFLRMMILFKIIGWDLAKLVYSLLFYYMFILLGLRFHLPAPLPLSTSPLALPEWPSSILTRLPSGPSFVVSLSPPPSLTLWAGPGALWCSQGPTFTWFTRWLHCIETISCASAVYVPVSVYLYHCAWDV